MNSITIKIVQKLVNRPTLNRQVSALSILSNNKHQKSNNSKSWFKKSLVISCGLGSIVGYSVLKEYFDLPILELPNVHAAALLAPLSRRSQFNFIADVVDITAKSLVFIEIQDTRRLDYVTKKPATVSNGSGFIVESDGLILTNAHVVTGNQRSIVSVKLSDGRIFYGNVEAIDPVSDLATVRIRCKGLPALKLGVSSTLRAGEFVVALGSPLCKFEKDADKISFSSEKFKDMNHNIDINSFFAALSNTVTSGVVSSTQRHSGELGLEGRDINYIQTDAAITFGNSGGPLVNLDGEVVGINSMKVTAGISFAIPIDYAKTFLTLASEKVKKGKPLLEGTQNRRYMGITMLTLTPEIILELKQRGSTIPESLQRGILVWKVILGSPAHNSGLIAGDIIIQINGKDVTQSGDIYEFLATKIKTLKLTVIRNGQLMTISVVPEDPE